MALRSVVVGASLAAAALAHGSGHREGEHMGALNPALGTHGYPDCWQPGSFDVHDIAANQLSMVCGQRGAPGTIKIGCVGDSITAGAHSSGPNMTYPAQLQAMLDPTKYAVTNLGACGSTMQKAGDSPYWQRPQYATLTANKWDVIVIMLGTNDAKDPGDGGPANWPAGACLDANGAVTLAGCRFADDYAAMIEVVRGLGTTPGVPPAIYVAVPPPLMQHGSIGANQTVINSIYPALIPLIALNSTLGTVPINVGASMGGVPNWAAAFPKSCVFPGSPWPACPWWCDKQSCDQCHPNDSGYRQLALTMKLGLGLD